MKLCTRATIDPGRHPIAECPLIGRRIPRIDSMAKATGEARFTVRANLGIAFDGRQKRTPRTLNGGIMIIESAAAEKEACNLYC